jgi:hypothetical protein
MDICCDPFTKVPCATWQQLLRQHEYTPTHYIIGRQYFSREWHYNEQRQASSVASVYARGNADISNEKELSIERIMHYFLDVYKNNFDLCLDAPLRGCGDRLSDFLKRFVGNNLGKHLDRFFIAAFRPTKTYSSLYWYY